MHKHPGEFVCLLVVASLVLTAVRVPGEQWSATGQVWGPAAAPGVAIIPLAYRCQCQPHILELVASTHV